MLSTKRNHASILADTTDPSSTTDNDKSEAKLTHTLSKSLKEILLPNNNLTSTENEKDVYHQYLNSPPPNTTNDNTNEQNKKIIELQTWLTNSMASVGVGSNFNTIKFWKEHINTGNNSSRGDNLTELYADSRYLVWFVKEILLPTATANNDASEGDVEKDTTNDSNTEQLLEIINEWHLSIHQLLSLNSTKAENDFNDNEEEDEEEDMTAGVMWQMLVQSSNLTPESIRESLDVYTSPQTVYEKDIASEDGDVALPGECFAWPSFFQHVTCAAKSQQYQSSNKRRRSNTSKSLSINNSNNSRKNENWYPLLGYAITYAFLSCNNGMTVQEKISHLKNNILDSLPYMLGIPNFDYNTKHLLCSGIVGCVLDEVGEWIVLDGLVLGEEGGGIINANDEEESNKQWRASVSQVVELFTVDGVLAKLAKVTNTPLSNLVAEVADSLMLYYSKVYQGLRSNQGSKDINGEDGSHLINDALQIASFIEKSDPQLTLQLASQKFIPSQYYSPGIDSAAPVHPIVIYTRALLFADSLVQASKLCRTLEDCVGIDNATKEHCYFLLFEKFQDLGVLFEDGWDTATKEEGGSRATLANITLGALGLKCAQNYLEHVVITAQDTLLSKPVQNSCLRRHKERAKQELLCVKDAVRRTVLKFLIPRAYSPHEALVIANELSLANSAPRLENVTLSNDTTVDAVYHIFATPTLYSIWNENLLSDEEEEEESKEDDSGPEETENIDLEQEEEEVVEPEEQAKDVPSSEEGNINEEEPRGAVQADEKDDDNEVIDLGDDTDEEEEVTAKQQQQSDAAESNDEEEQVDSVDEEDLAEEQQDDITYPRHYQQFAGNYSESDDYDAEDNEEADRHLAFEGMYDDQEGQGGSDNEEHDEGQVCDAGMIELLDSSDEDENEHQQEEEMMKRSEDESSEADNDSDETGALNEAVDKYIAKQEGKEHVESDDDYPADESIDKTDQGDEAQHDSSEEQQELEAKILSEAVHEYINPSTGAKEDVNDSIEEEHGREKNDGSIQQDIDVSEKEEGALAAANDVEVQKQAVEEQAVKAPGSPSKPMASPAVRRSTRERKPSPKKRAAMESTAASGDKKTEPVGSKNDESSQHDVDVNEKGSDVIGNNDAEKTSVLEEGEDGDKNDESNKNDANEPTVEDGTELYDLLADDEHESIDTEDDKRSVSQEQLEPEAGDNIKDDANNNMEKDEDLSARISKYMSPKYQAEKKAEESPLKPADGDGDKVEVENEGEKQPSVLVAAAMSTQRQGNNFDQSSTPNRFELPPEGFEGAEDDDDEAQSVDGNDSVSIDHTSAARASTDNDSLVVGEAAMTDDGYVPDDAGTEVERADRAKKESIRKKAIDDGYVPDASEASEVEQSEAAIPDSNTKRRSAVRDVRFETDLETKINDAVVPGIDGVATSQSIDDGYLPDESEVERGETLKRRTQQGIDQGYLPDGHTTPGDATEEDHGEDDAAVSDVVVKDDTQKKSSDVMDVDTDKKVLVDQSKVATDVAMPVETRLYDTIDEGYLPSAGEQELSEKEEVTLATTNDVVVQEQQIDEEPVTEAGTPSVRQSSRDRKPSPKKKAAMESSLATNKLVQEQQVGEQAKEAGTPLNMDSSSTVRRSTRDRKPSPKKMAAMESSSASVNDKKTETIQEGTLEKKSPAKANKRTYRTSIEKATAEYWNEVNEKSTLQESDTQQDDLSKEIATQQKDIATQQKDVSEESNKGEPVKDPLQEPTASKEAITQASPLDTAAIDAAVEACNNINAADITSPNPTNEAGVDTTTTSQQREDLSILTVVQLKDRLRGLNLAVGGRKQELIDRLNDHLYPNLTENEEVKDVPIANQEQKQAQAGSTSTRRSRRGKKPSAKAAPEKQQDTPISELSHPVDSETDDDDGDSVQKKHFTSSSKTAETDSKPSPGVPSSIVTRRSGKKKSSPSLPVVPEGETVEDSKVEGPKVAVKLVDEEASKRSTRSTRSTRQSKKKNDEAADHDTTTSVSTRGSRRIAAQKKSSDTSSKRSTRSRQSVTTKESSPPKRRSGRAKKGADESVSTRGSKRVAASMDAKADTTEKAPPAKRRSRKTETEEESASSSRRSTRRTTATKTDESVGTRRSTRSRSKK